MLSAANAVLPSLLIKPEFSIRFSIILTLSSDVFALVSDSLALVSDSFALPAAAVASAALSVAVCAEPDQTAP